MILRDLWIVLLKTAGAKIYGLLLGFISVAFTARFLGAEGRGEFVVVTTWVTTFATLACLSLGQVALHKAAHSNGDTWLPKTYHAFMLFAVIMTIGAWAAAAVLYWAPFGNIFGQVNPIALLVGFLMLPLKIWEQYATSLLQAIQRLDIHIRYVIIGSSIGLVCTAIFILVFNFGVVGAILGAIIGQVVVVSGGIKLFNQLASGWKKPDLTLMKYYIFNGGKLHLNTIGMFFISGSDILMINYFMGPKETAWYQLAVQLVGMIMIIPQVANMVIYSKVCEIGPKAAWPIHRRMLWQVTGLVLVVVCFLDLTIGWWLPIIVGDDYKPSVEVFRWLSLASVGMTFSMMMAPQWIGRGYFMIASTLTIFMGIFSLALNYLFIRHYGMMGAIVATLIIYAFSVATNYFMVIHCNRHSEDNT